jgi:hypothetical protein
VFTVQADPGLGEKAISKKSGQLESQALQKQVQASALYEKCNEIKFSLYRQYIGDFWKDHAGEESNYINAKLIEEQASDNYFQATSYRIEAKKMDEGFAKVEKLTEANNLESQAIQKQLTALGVYHGIGESVSEETSSVESLPVVTPEQPVENVPVTTTPSAVPSPDTLTERTLPGQVEINQSMIEDYNRYQATEQFSDTTLSTGKLAGVTSFDSDKILQLWHEYIYGRDSLGNEPVRASRTDTTQNTVDEKPTGQITTPSAHETEIGVVTDENKGTLVPVGDDVIYRVQLAANRSELSQRALSRMYYGNNNVEMINEDGWYK